MSNQFERISTALSLIAAFTLVGILAHREFSTPSNAAKDTISYFKDWRELQVVGRTIGDTAAKVKIIAFSDFQCPFCAQFHKRAVGAVARHPHDVSLTYVNFPLEFHKSARRAAIAAECAHVQDRYAQMSAVLFQRQKAFDARNEKDIRDWISDAVTATIPDTAQFEKCLLGETPLPLIEAGVKLGDRLGVSGTPTVFINGYRHSIPPSDSLIEHEISRALGRARGSVLDRITSIWN